MIGIKDILKDYIVISLSALLISALLTPIIRKSCQQKRLLDFPTTARKIHTVPIPRLGGVAIYLAFFLPLFAVFLSEGPAYDLFMQNVDMLISLFITSTLVFAIGVYDDIRGATVSQKFLVQCSAAVMIYFLGFKIQLISIPFVGSVSPGILGFPLTILWIVGVTNALNFIDGIDGLACGVGFFSISTMFVLSLYLNRPLTAFFATALAGGLLGFGLYNFAPASIFMGDSGSLFIGFVIAAISLHSSQKSSTAVILLIPIVALGVPITDTLLAIIRRIGNGLSPFTADKEHIHHRLLRLGFSARQVTLVLYAVCSLFGVMALLMTAVNNKVLTFMLILLSIMVIGGVKMLGYTADMIAINRLAKERIQQKKRFLERQRSADEIISTIQASSDRITLKKMLIRYFENMRFDIGAFSGEVEKPLEFTWYSEQYEERAIAPDQVWTITIPVMVNDERIGELFVGKHLNSTETLFESIMLVEYLKAAVEQMLTRLSQHDS